MTINKAADPQTQWQSPITEIKAMRTPTFHLFMLLPSITTLQHLNPCRVLTTTTTTLIWLADNLTTTFNHMESRAHASTLFVEIKFIWLYFKLYWFADESRVEEWVESLQLCQYYKWGERVSLLSSAQTHQICNLQTRHYRVNIWIDQPFLTQILWKEISAEISVGNFSCFNHKQTFN